MRKRKRSLVSRYLQVGLFLGWDVIVGSRVSAYFTLGKGYADTVFTAAVTVLAATRVW